MSCVEDATQEEISNSSGLPGSLFRSYGFRPPRQAADQGHAGAQYDLGVMYHSGQGVPQDDVEAHKWYNLAASRAGYLQQQGIAATRDALAKKMTPAQLAEAQKLAREWQAAFEKR